MEISWKALRGSTLSARQLHDILALRIEEFVVQHTCPNQDIDDSGLKRRPVNIWMTASPIRTWCIRTPESYRA